MVQNLKFYFDNEILFEQFDKSFASFKKITNLKSLVEYKQLNNEFYTNRTFCCWFCGSNRSLLSHGCGGCCMWWLLSCICIG